MHCTDIAFLLYFCAAAASALDALEDSSEALLWRWELRDCKVLPKALRLEAVRRKKELHKARMPVHCCTRTCMIASVTKPLC